MVPVVFFVLGGATVLLAPKIYKSGLKLAVSAKDHTVQAMGRFMEDVEDARAEAAAERQDRQREPRPPGAVTGTREPEGPLTPGAVPRTAS
jgi:hypothetical protein